MNDSILNDVKKILGIDEADDSFDTDLIIYINTMLLPLRQLGVNTSSDFVLHDASETWEDLIYNQNGLSAIKTWLALKVRKVFDPPQSGTTMEALNSSINELEWRINVEVDPVKTE